MEIKEGMGVKKQIAGSGEGDSRGIRVGIGKLSRWILQAEFRVQNKVRLRMIEEPSKGRI